LFNVRFFADALNDIPAASVFERAPGDAAAFLGAYVVAGLLL